MTEQELHRANAIASRLKELKDNLERIRQLKESYEDGNTPKLAISTSEGHIPTEIFYHLSPISFDDLFEKYIEYSQAEIDEVEKEFKAL